jgi:hypothetical protein
MSRRFIGITLVILAVAIFTFSVTTAQDITPIQYGQIVIGNIPSDGGQVVYTFSGTANDLVTIRALGTVPNMNLDVTLLSTTQQALLISAEEPFAPLSIASTLVYRLPETGTFFIVVTGNAGDFLLTLESRSAVTATTLNLDTPVELSLPFSDNQPQAFIFNTDPASSTTLQIDAEPFDLDAVIEVRDGSGQLVTLLQGGVDNACINMGPGDEIRELLVASSPSLTTTGTITISLSNRACTLGEPVAPPVVPTIQPIPIEGVCAATSAGFVNIRNGPSTQYNIISFLSPRQPIQVVGISESGTWLVVQNSVLQGWVAMSVVAVTGPCDGLPVFPTPPLPAPVTPGMPLFTSTPFVITGTPGPTQTPVIVTATAITPEATEVTPEVTPTVEVTVETITPEATASATP